MYKSASFASTKKKKKKTYREREIERKKNKWVGVMGNGGCVACLGHVSREAEKTITTPRKKAVCI